MFNPVAARAVIKITDFLATQKGGIPIKTWNVVEFGNQRFGAKECLPKGFPFIESTKDFYKVLGFEYSCIDVNTNQGAIIADLNRPIRPQLKIGYHTLVTNNGTGEHIFDQRLVFENAHELCNVGGVMLHVLPFAPWENHGFYNYNPILFRDLAAANGYKILFLWMTTRNDPAPVDLFSGTDANPNNWVFQEKRPKLLQKWIKDRRAEAVGGPKEIYLTVAFQRMSPHGFKVPLQGKYKKDVEGLKIKEDYAL